MNFDKIQWKTIESYFLSNPYNLTQHHLNSYNNFFDNEIFQIIKEKNPIKITKNFDETLDDFKFKVDIYIGGINGDKLYYGKPIIYDENHTHYMYPNEARLRNMNYGFTVHYDVLVKYKIIHSNGEISEDSIIVQKIYLGKFPIMLHSNKCVLRGVNRELLYNMGECKNDYGGYFIIDGKEKVVVPQEKFSDNMVYFKKGNEDDYNICSAIIRMKSEDASKPVRTMKVNIVNETDKEYRGNIVVEIPNVRKPIPLFILMRALGITSDKEIIKYCILDLEMNEEYIDYLKPSVYDAGTIFTQENAIKYISQFLKFKNIHYTYCILCDYLLPQIGVMNFRSKAFYIGYMVLNLLKTNLNHKKETDRDSFKYKRVELPGTLIYDLFKEYYNLQQKQIQLHVENDLYYHYTNPETNYLNITEKQFVEEVFSSEFIKEDKKDNKKKFKLGYNEIFKDKIVHVGFNRAFKGNWGATPQTKKVGVVQDLNRLSYNSGISQLRKLNLPLDSSAKVVGPRLCHSSQYGLIDPMDTPDGGNCGLHKHLAITSFITNGYSSKKMLSWLRENVNLTLLNECLPDTLKHKTKIFINGSWIGVVNQLISIYNLLKFSRRVGFIPVFTSISANYKENEIEIYTDSGRITRPLFYINESKELSTNCKSFRDLVSKKEYINWKDMVIGFNKRKLEVDLFGNKFYKISELYGLTLDEINKHKAIVDYVDTAEVNCSLVSTDIDKLKYNKRFTHLEIHPSCIFGFMGNLVIYPETNPLPRNLFSCGQSKQAVSVYSTNFNNRVDKTGIVLNYGQIPLVKTRYLDYFHKEEMSYGVNTIVAIGCYGGYNVEDAILINKGAVDRGLFRTTYFSVYESREESSVVKGSTVNSKFANVEKMEVDRKKYDYDYTYLDERGLVKENTKLDDKVIVIGKVTVDGEKINTFFDSSVKTKRGQLGFVDKAFITDDEEGFRLAKVRIRDERIPSIGDKMASRAGQKGTIGLVIEEENMPFTSDGIKPDLIINPHALPSRMTIGQLLECITGKACSYYGNFGNCTAFQNVDGVKIFGNMLNKAGFESTGNEVLYNGYTGEQLETSIFIGPTYYMRLKHMVKDKINYRARGRKTGLTKQPVQGRANDGGLRIGEMERDGVIGHGASNFLKESMMTRGDDYQIAICNNSGTMAVYNKEKNLMFSLFEDGPIKFKGNQNELKLEKMTHYGRDFSLVDVPYSFKLLIHELQAMGIQTRIITEDNIKQLEHMSYSSNYKVMTREIDNIEELKDMIPYYGRKDIQTRNNIREEREDDIYFEVDTDYDLHEFDSEDEEEPDKKSPEYSLESTGYSPETDENRMEPNFTPKIDTEISLPMEVDEDFNKIYIKKYPRSHYGERLAAYVKFLDDGTIVAPEFLSEDKIKGGPTEEDLERYAKLEEREKIKLDMGEREKKDDNLEKVSETNLTYETNSILQPDNVELKENESRVKELKQDMKSIEGEGKDDENDEEDSETNESGSGKKKIKLEL